MTEVVGEGVVVIRTDESQVDGAGSGKRAGEGFTSGFGGKLKGLAAAAGVAAVAAGVSKVFVNALNFDAAGAKMQAQLGLTEKQSAAAGKVAGDLYSENYGESITDVQNAVGTVIGSIKGMRRASEADLEAASRAALQYADVFDTDLQTAVSGASRLINTGLAKDSEQAFDLLTRASQKVPAALREDLFASVEEYSQFFNQVGLGGEQAFASLAGQADLGVFGIDKAGDAVKEFTIRATDMSTASQDAYKAIGLDAQEMSNSILQGGDKAGAATQKIIDGLLGIKDPSEQANTAIALFGTPLEDLGTKNIPDFLSSLQGTSKGFDDVAGATEKAANQMYDTPLVQLQGMWRSLQGTIMDLAVGALPPLLRGFDVVSKAVGDFLPVVQAGLQPVLATIADTFTTSVLPALSSLWAYLSANVIPIFQQVAGIIATQVVPMIISLATYFYGTVYPAIVQVATVVATKLRPVFDALVQTFTTKVLPTVQKVIEQVRNQLIPALLPIIQRVAQVIGWLVKLAAAILGKVLPPLIRLAGFIIANVVPAIVSIITWVVKVIGKIIEFGAALVQGVSKVVGFGAALVRLVTGGISQVVSAVAGLPGRILALGGRMLDAGKAIIGKFVDGLKRAGGVVGDIAGNVWNAVKGLLNNAIDRINAALEFKISLPGPDITINPPNIPHLATGTDYFGGGWAVVGEQGRELVTLPRGARVTPHAETERILGSDGDAGAQTVIRIGQMMPHDYGEFERQMRAQSRLAALGGRRPTR